MNEKLQLTREKCIAANLEKERKELMCPECKRQVVTHGTAILRQPPIRLADVLLAIGTLKRFSPAPEAFSIGEHLSLDFFAHGDDANRFRISWNLRADSLEQQSEETVKFLWELLK